MKIEIIYLMGILVLVVLNLLTITFYSIRFKVVKAGLEAEKLENRKVLRLINVVEKENKDTLDQLHIYKEAFTYIKELFHLNPVAILEDNVIKTNYEVKANGSVICRLRIRKPVEKKISRPVELVLLHSDKQSYFKFNDLKRLRTLAPRDISDFFKTKSKLVSKK